MALQVIQEPAFKRIRMASGVLMPKRWKSVVLIATAAGIVGATPASADPGPPSLGIELNTIEPVEDKCRLTFVMSNPDKSTIDSLKADTAIFGSDGVIKRRLVIEFGPLKPQKTSIRAFDLDLACSSLGSLLVNDIVACMPDALGDCLTRLELSSRTPVKLFK